MLIDFRVDMTVRSKQIEPAVIVVVEKSIAPPYERNCCLRDAGLVTHVRKAGVAVVVVKHLVVIAEIGDKKADQPAVLVVARGDAHGGNLSPILVQREARHVAFVVERPVSFIDVEEVRLRVVPDHKVWFAVIIDVDEDCGETVVLVFVLNSGLYRDVAELEFSVLVFAIVVEQVVGLTLQATRAAVHRHPR